MTGSRSALDFAGVHTLSVRQSSLDGATKTAVKCDRSGRIRGLRAPGSELRGVSNVGPGLWRRGWAPSAIADGRSGVRDALEDHDNSLAAPRMGPDCV